MDNKLTSAIHKEAMRVFPQEACGVVVAKGKKSVVVPCKNIAEDPERYFVIDPVEYAKACKLGEVIAVWHTHPNGTSDASGADLVGCESTAMEWIIIGFKKAEDEFVFEDPKSFHPTGVVVPYIGRPYITGVQDCFSLMSDYYNREFGIRLGKYIYAERWWEQGKSLFADNFLSEGFNKLINEEPQVGDCFLIQCGARVPNHIAIYMGDDKILHHCIERLSRIDVYGGGYWQKHTTHHIRHKSKC